MVAGSILISMIYVATLRFFVKPILYLSMLVVLVGFIGTGVWAWM